MLFLFVANIFISACLLFMVQPLFARMVMPLLGGSPSVWITSMVFYQMVLLLGYVYAHRISAAFGKKRMLMVHGVVVLVPLVVLPMQIPDWWTPSTAVDPTLSVLVLLLVIVGLPFFVLSSNGPLVQLWFSKTGHRHAADPYFLYAASNIGSMIGLLGYPLLMEPYMSVSAQSLFWLGGYIAYALFVLLCAVILLRRSGASDSLPTPSTTTPKALFSGEASTSQDADIPPLLKAKWVFWAFMASSLMIGLTSYLSNSTDVQYIPFFWVLPLVVYLLSFIVVFSRRNLVPRGVMTSPMTAVLLVFMVLSMERYYDPEPFLQLGLHAVFLFLVCVVCHKVVVDARPPARQLTTFYIWMSLGGILGGVFNSLMAPFLFDIAFEYWLVLFVFMLSYIYRAYRSGTWGSAYDFIGAIVLLLTALFIDSQIMDYNLVHYANIGLGVGLLAYGATLLFMRRVSVVAHVGTALLVVYVGLKFLDTSGYVHVERSYFGISRVKITDETVKMYHGNTNHGEQRRDPDRLFSPTAYYHQAGPLGDFFRYIEPESADFRIGVVGLGAGGMLSYARPAQQWTYFEIDPVVVDIASNTDYFTLVSTYKPRIVLGDGRASLEREEEDSYDVLIFDAYSSGSMPLHLLTLEAIQMYAEKLKPDGYMIFHVSNRHLALEHVVGNIAAELGYVSVMEDYEPDEAAEDDGANGSTWVVLAKDLGSASDLGPGWFLLGVDESYPVWTDERNSLFSVVRW